MNRFALAEQMHCTVRELDQRLTPDEFAHWIAYGRIRHEEMEEEKRKAKAAAAASR